jgi:hypothetical protein
MVFKKLIICLVFIISLLGMIFSPLAHQSVYACGGGNLERMTLAQNIEAADVVVKGTIVETGGSNENSVLQVERYLMGEGISQLLLYRISPLYQALRSRDYDVGCYYPLSNNPRPSIGLSGYFILTRLETGAYRYALSEGPSYISLESYSDVHDELEEAIRTYGQFNEDGTPQRSGLSITAPVLITTSTGSQYMIPIDGGEPVSYENNEILYDWYAHDIQSLFTPIPTCIDVGCKLSVPSGTFYGEIIEEGQLAFDYPSSPFYVEDYVPIEIEGSAFSFSPSGNILLVWNKIRPYQSDTYRLTLYQISIQPCQCNYGYGVPSLHRMTDITLTSSRTVDFPPAWEFIRWSADGSTFIYSDVEGLWLMDIFRRTAPERVVLSSGGGFIYPRFVSHSGRYFGYSFNDDRQNWITVDRLYRETYINAFPSPNEHYMSYFPDRSRPREEFSILPLTDDGCAYLPCSLYGLGLDNSFIWIEQEEITYYIYISCYSLDGCSVRTIPFGHQPYAGYRMTPRINNQITHLVYDPYQNVVIYSEGNYSLHIEGVYRATYDFEGKIDGQIVHIQWMPSLLYAR